MGLNDRYKLIDHQDFLSQDVTNVYWYQQIEGSGGADRLALAFINDVLGSIRAVQHGSLVHATIEVINFDDEADFYQEDLTTGNAGMRTGETLPKFNAWGFKLHRPTRLIRSGAKRIAGVAEGDQDAGIPSSGITAALDNLADALSAVITDGADNYWQPQIVSLSADGSTIVNDIGFTVASFSRLTTQNSRKR